MKTILLALLLTLVSLELPAQPAPPGPGGAPAPVAPAAPAAGAGAEETVPPGYIDFQGVDVEQVLEVYAKLVNKTILHASLPKADIVLKTQTTLTRTEAIEALKAVLAMNNVSLIDMDDKFVKAVQSDQANSQGGPFSTVTATNLPDVGGYMTRIVQLKHVLPSQMIDVLKNFAKLPNSLVGMDSNGILIIRDNVENVKRMMEMIDQIDIAVPAVYISEVIPIRYAQVDDIAAALSSLAGGGGATVSIGTAPSSTPISGLSGNRGNGSLNSGIGGINSGINGGVNPFAAGSTARPFGSAAATPNGTPSSPTSYTQRLNNLLGNRGQSSTAGEAPIQLFGEIKIIPDESSSSLLVFATRQDMEMITNVVAKLDVPLAQVLIEAVIMDVTLGNQFNFGVSAAQNPVQNGNTHVGGGMNNGPSFFDFANNALGTNVANGVFGNSLGSGLSYFGDIGPNWDVAITAAQQDSHASIIQTPRIQASQAVPAQFFVGNTVPYITATYNYGGAYGNQSSYSQLSVGVELDVKPFINPDGEVKMEIQQHIDSLGTPVTIDGNPVPTTTSRSLNTTITVRDKDTVMLGGFVETSKQHSKAGVPFLQDIPLLGNLFTSRNDQKDRSELIVLMRPTVLKTPELAARNTVMEAQRLPGASAAAAEEAQEQSKLIEAERKKELNDYKNGVNTNGFFNVFLPPDTTVNTTPVISAPENKMSTPAISSSQKARLDALLNSYMAGKITREEYEADRQKILSEGR